MSPDVVAVAGSALASLHSICLRLAAAAAAAVAMAKKWLIDLRRAHCRDAAKGQEANTRSAMEDGL